jgi:hypothetical protein
MVCSINIFLSVFGFIFILMIFINKSKDFIHGLSVLVIGQLFSLISDITFFIIVKQTEKCSYSFDFFAFLLAIEICYFLSMFELYMHSESLIRINGEQGNLDCELPTYEEAAKILANTPK